MMRFSFEQCAPLIDGDGPDPAQVGAADADTKRGAIVTGPRALMAKITGFRLTETGALHVRSARTGVWGDAPDGFLSVELIA
ncbi:hypothetical protein [Oceanicaulis sp. MMSF_3324]|uniref:hypothetical protein n=1 Tax=Oceanicaulis sp. MMSF_3324 TaxID=3046702 RepID=UPI00273FC8B5|nr:hypothetical protein [Oceanicaulis sp. MMSF_3324]